MNGDLRRASTAGAAVAMAVVALCAAAIGSGLVVDAPRPFVWLDVAVVYFVAALPLATTGVVLAMGRLPWRGSTILLGAVQAAALCIVPELYVRARLRNDFDAAAGLAWQERWAEAQRLVEHGQRLRPRATHRGLPVRALAKEVQGHVEQLERRVAEELPAGADGEAVVKRGQQLGKLGRTDEALEILDSSPEPEQGAEASELRGTIYEMRKEWDEAIAWYARSKEAWGERPESAERSTGVERSTRGLAFCERKRGRLKAAETAWLEFLELKRDAGAHFLVAQFYEDTQQAAKARYHAQQAASLAPELYTQETSRLIDKLVTSHFGCWGAFSADNSPSTPFGGESLNSKIRGNK